MSEIDHRHITGGVEEDEPVLAMHLSRDHGVEPGMLVDPAEWHRGAHRALEGGHAPSDWDGVVRFKPGDRVEVFPVPGGYVVAHPRSIDEEVARQIADASTPLIEALEDDDAPSP